jgi:hypothetical protein
VQQVIKLFLYEADAARAVKENHIMAKLQVKLELPDPLAKEAEDMGLLEPNALQDMVREAVRKRHIAQFAEVRRKVAEAGIPPMTTEEIQAEIDAYRAERRAKNAG